MDGLSQLASQQDLLDSRRACHCCRECMQAAHVSLAPQLDCLTSSPPGSGQGRALDAEAHSLGGPHTTCGRVPLCEGHSESWGRGKIFGTVAVHGVICASACSCLVARVSTAAPVGWLTRRPEAEHGNSAPTMYWVDTLWTQYTVHGNWASAGFPCLGQGARRVLSRWDCVRRVSMLMVLAGDYCSLVLADPESHVLGELRRQARGQSLTAWVARHLCAAATVGTQSRVVGPTQFD